LSTAPALIADERSGGQMVLGGGPEDA